MLKLRSAVLKLAVAIALATAFGAARAEDLAISADASLTDAFQDIGKTFEAAHPGLHVIFTFAASGALLQQLAQSTTADVFASADEETMDKAQKQNLIIAPSRAAFAANTLVLIVPATAGSVPEATTDLLHDDYHRIAIGNPALVPAGRYAQETLDIAGIRAEAEQKLTPSESERQVLASVARGDADAGIVYASDALLAKDKVKVALPLPTKTPIRYSASVIAASKNAGMAKAFITYLQSADGQAVLRKYGFLAP